MRNRIRLRIRRSHFSNLRECCGGACNHPDSHNQVAVSDSPQHHDGRTPPRRVDSRLDEYALRRADPPTPARFRPFHLSELHALLRAAGADAIQSCCYGPSMNGSSAWLSRRRSRFESVLIIVERRSHRSLARFTTTHPALERPFSPQLRRVAGRTFESECLVMRGRHRAIVTAPFCRTVIRHAPPGRGGRSAVPLQVSSARAPGARDSRVGENRRGRSRTRIPRESRPRADSGRRSVAICSIASTSPARDTPLREHHRTLPWGSPAASASVSRIDATAHHRYTPDPRSYILRYPARQHPRTPAGTRVRPRHENRGCR